METIIAQNVGVDISKATLDVHLHPAGIARQFANDANGIKALLSWLVGRDIARIVFEPTGPYHHRLERRLAVRASHWPRSTRYRRGALPRPPAHMQKPTRSMLLCWREWAPCSHRQSARSSVRRLMR